MSEPVSPSRIVGRYALHSEIAAGGMATVHLGRLLGLVGFSRMVAVKRLHPQFAKDPEFVAMFLDEARLAARIRHPNVVPTLDVVAENGELFLVMEYVHGEPLSKLVRLSTEPIAPQVVAAIVAGALHGLHAAHEATDERGMPLDIVHRDVSPQNVFVGADGIARVLDFGIAKAAGRIQVSREGQIKGKLAYMAPEYVRRGTASRKTDIYAAAVVLWEALTRRRLFEAENEYTLFHKMMEHRVDPPSHFVPGLPAAFDAVAMRGLSRDPAARFETAREMAIALERCAGVASTTEVGEWVARTAAEGLGERARLMTLIESHPAHGGVVVAGGSATSTPAPPAAMGAAAPRRLSIDAESEVLTVERIGAPATLAAGQEPAQHTAVTMTASFDKGRPRRSRAIVVASVVVVIALALGVGGAQLGARTPAPSLETTTAPSSTDVAPAPAALDVDPSVSAAPGASAAPSSISSLPEASGSTSDGATSATGVTGVAGVTAKAPSTRRPALPSRPATTGAPGNTSSACNPPYVVDAQGIRRLKRECLPK
jgi:hypothetical protein